MRDLGAKTFLDAGYGILGVFDGVVENRGGKSDGVEPHVGENVRDFEQVGKIGFAGTAELVVVALGGNFVGAANHPGIFRGAVLLELVEEFFEARVELANRAVAVEAQRKVARRRHVLVYASQEKEWKQGRNEVRK